MTRPASLAVLLAVGLATTARAQPFTWEPSGQWHPYTTSIRQYHGSWPDNYGTAMGVPTPFFTTTYNPLLPTADFDRDGIVNSLDPDADNDGKLNHEETGYGFWTFPQGSTDNWAAWMFTLSRWQSDYGFNSDPVTNTSAMGDSDGDGEKNGAGPGVPQPEDTDDDNDGFPDLIDIDNIHYQPRSELQDWDGDGTLDGPDLDLDGDGIDDNIDIGTRGGGNWFYQPSATATVNDWDGDGTPNECDPYPMDPRPGWRGENLYPPGDDFDGDGWPNECDPNPCITTAGWDDDPDGDMDGDGYPNRCDPFPCDGTQPAEPPPDPDNPCDPGTDPPDPPGPTDPPDPPDPPDDDDRPDPPPPNDRPNPEPPEDDPPPPPPDPPDPPLPPVVPPPPSDDACCEAICSRLDVLIQQEQHGLGLLTNILAGVQRFTGDGDTGGAFQHFYERMISDPDSMRNRMDDGLVDIVDKLDLVIYEIQWTNQLLSADDDTTDPDLPDRPDGFPEPRQFLDDQASAIDIAMGDHLAGLEPFPDVSQYSDDADAPVWSWTLNTPNFGVGASHDLSIEVDFAPYSTVRPAVHAVLLLLCVVHGCMMIWEELRRYG